MELPQFSPRAPDPTFVAAKALLHLQKVGSSSRLDTKSLVETWKRDFDPDRLLKRIDADEAVQDIRIELTPLATLFILWPWDALLMALHHLKKNGLTWGLAPDVLSGMDWRENHRKTKQAGLNDKISSDHPVPGRQGHFAETWWSRQAGWHRKMTAIDTGRPMPHAPQRQAGSVWGVLQARIWANDDEPGMEGVVDFLVQEGVNPMGAEGILEAATQNWRARFLECDGMVAEPSSMMTLARIHPIFRHGILNHIQILENSEQSLFPKTRQALFEMRIALESLIMDADLPLPQGQTPSIPRL
jgi:hypothetical protein